MNVNFRCRKVLITGGGSGIGKAIAKRFIKPYEIAELAFYLMSNFGEIICGHTVVADGGDNCATL